MPRSNVRSIADILCIAIMAFVLTWATILLNDVPERRRDAPEGPWPPSRISRLLTVPIPSTGMTDLRGYAVPTGLAWLLILLALGRGSFRHVLDNGRVIVSRTPGAGDHSSFLKTWWFESLAIFAVSWSLLSAIANGTWSISQGWIFSLACGCGWAILIARCASRQLAGTVIRVASVILVVSALMALWHRFAMGDAFFELPIGPVTITAALGALGTAFAAVWLYCATLFRSDHQQITPASVVWPIVTGAIFVALMAVAARRGAWIALVAALALTIGMATSIRFRGRPLHAALLLILVAGLLAAGIHLQQNVMSPRGTATATVQVRAAYWKHLLDRLPSKLLFGNGPDTFACEMTTAMALKRAEQPRFFRGRVDYEAHNEWLQSAFELGLPGFAAYIAMPLGVIAGAIRRWKHAPTESGAALRMACAAGLIVIFVSDSGSINLRHPILSAWYWTLLGVALALLRTAEDAPSDAVRPRARRPLIRWLAVLAGTFLVLLVVMDIRRGMFHAQGRMAMSSDVEFARELFERSLGRFGIRNWLWIRSDLATLHSNRLRANRRAEDSARRADGAPAIAAWREVYDACPGYPEAGYRLAEALFLTGDTEGARDVVSEYLRRIHPYDRMANLLRIQLGGLSMLDKLDGVRRALRSSPIDSFLAGIALRELATNEPLEAWSRLVEQARLDARKPDASEWIDSLAPETLRLEAVRQAAAGQLDAAAESAALAAEIYGVLAGQNSPIRRPVQVEADAWYLAARMRFDARPGQYKAAFEMIRRAEREARLELAAQPGRSPNQLDLSPVALRNRTPELRQLLRFSAQMHMVVGADPFEIARRANWSLPGQTHSQSQVDLELARMAAELVSALSTLPEAERPSTAPHLEQLARQAVP